MNKAKSYNSPLLDHMFDEIPEKEFKKTERRMKLAIKIADAMKVNGYSKVKFAGLMNQHPSVITKWLSGTHNFTIDTLFDLEQTLNIKLVSVGEDIVVDKNKTVYQTIFVQQTTPFVEDFSMMNFSPQGSPIKYIIN